MPKFSVIAVDYEHHVRRNAMAEGIKSIANQSFKDYELIICHDGPRQGSYDIEIDFNELGIDPKIINTPYRVADWGHSSRDFAMRQATGDYFIQFNIDNIFYDYAFGMLSDFLNNIPEEIVIFQVKHWKALGGMPMRGVPPVHCNIDCMQLVASARIWREVGYWYRKEGTSDGLIYQDMCERYPWREFPMLLGENF